MTQVTVLFVLSFTPGFSPAIRITPKPQTVSTVFSPTNPLQACRLKQIASIADGQTVKTVSLLSPASGPPG